MDERVTYAMDRKVAIPEEPSQLRESVAPAIVYALDQNQTRNAVGQKTEATHAT